MLNAAMLDERAADAVRTGLVVGGFSATGMGELDPAALVAVPEALGHRAAPVVPPRHGLTVVEPSRDLRREAAEEALAQAAADVTEAERQVAVVRGRHDVASARVLQLESELDELRRRAAVLEDQAVEAEDEVGRWAGELAGLGAELEQATRRRDAAQEALDDV